MRLCSDKGRPSLASHSLSLTVRPCHQVTEARERAEEAKRRAAVAQRAADEISTELERVQTQIVAVKQAQDAVERHARTWSPLRAEASVARAAKRVKEVLVYGPQADAECQTVRSELSPLWTSERKCCAAACRPLFARD